MKKLKAIEAIQSLSSNQNIFIHSAAAAPQCLISALVKRAENGPEIIKNIKIYQLHTEGPAPYAEEKFKGQFEVQAFFIGGNVRQAVRQGRAQYIPIFLSEIPALFHTKAVPLDVALIQISPPDRHGYCSLGTSVDVSLAAIKNAKLVIAQMNPQFPSTHGDAVIPLKDIDMVVEEETPLPEVACPSPSEVEKKIARHVAGLIDDGATLQMGIGAIPNAVLNELIHHKNLGIHTEMFSDGLLPLVEKGVVTGSEKKIFTGKIVSSFVVGTKALYDFVHENPSVLMMETAFVNDTHIIRKNPQMVAINSAIEVDLTGQVCADSIGARPYSGVGGQMDFVRGAALSPGGKPIMALPSLTTKGESKIVPFLKQGAGVVTTRAHVHYVVTEFGVACVHGKTLKERAQALIKIAHPSVQEKIEREYFNYVSKL